MRQVVCLVAAFIAATAGSALVPASAADKPECKPDTVFSNEEVKIWFHSMTGFIRITDFNTSAGQGSYSYKQKAIVELDDAGEPLRTMSLNRAFPGTSACVIEESEEFVNMTLTVTDTVKNVRGGRAGEATATLVYHFNKTAYGAKFDLFVEDWPWAAGAADHELAYDFRVHTGDLRLREASNGIGIEDESGQKQGYVEWAENATVTYEDGSTAEANVTSEYEGDEHTLDVRLTFTDVDGGYVDLAYDPWMGIGDWIIVANRLIGLAFLEERLPAGAGRTVRSLL